MADEKLLPIYSKIYENATLEFKGKILDPSFSYDLKLETVLKISGSELSRQETARIYYWLYERFKKEQKIQKEKIPDKYKTEEYKKYEEWVENYDVSIHNIYNSVKKQVD